MLKTIFDSEEKNLIQIKLKRAHAWKSVFSNTLCSKNQIEYDEFNQNNDLAGSGAFKIKIMWILVMLSLTNKSYKNY